MTKPIMAWNQTVENMKGFRNLEVGWHYGTGGPISKAVIESALELHESLMHAGITQTDAFPGQGREILLTGDWATDGNKHCLSIIIEPDGSFSIRHDRDDVELDELETTDIDSVKERICNHQSIR